MIVTCLVRMKMEIRYSGYILLIFIFSFLVQTALALCSECTDGDKGTTLTACQSAASKLEEAEVSNNVSLVCSRLLELLRCVAEKVPQCLDVFSEGYMEYMYTPWDCHMSNEQRISYQKLVQNGCTSVTETHTSNSALDNNPKYIQYLVVLYGMMLLNDSRR